MRKTTVYLPDDLKRALSQVAAKEGRSEAEVLREAVAQIAARVDVPSPKLPLFRGKGPSIAGDIDRALSGFGQQ